MGLAKRAAIFFVRPTYKRVFERPLWWFLAIVKTFFFAETSERLVTIENRLTALEKLQGIEEQLRRLNEINAAQWDAIEQLLLAMFRQPDSRIVESGGGVDASQHAALSSATELNQANGPRTLR
jgi:hypothetical protein